jgi:hypothetical protein
MSKNPKTPSDVDDEDASFWEAEINAAKDRQECWYRKADVAIDRYKDNDEERPFGGLNILWANTEVQKAALGEDFGSPQVNRLNATSSMHLSRHISLVWQQAIEAAVRDTDDNREIRNGVHDILLPGRGQVWLEMNPIEDENGNVIWIEAPIVKVEFKDYLEGPANRWGDVPWVSRAHLYTIDDLMDQFGMTRAAAESVPREYALPAPKGKERRTRDESADQFKRARVHEIWAKFPKKRRIYFAEGHKKALAVTPDPYRLKKFFPCPRPILANGDEAWQLPLTDYSRYQDQAEEINRLSQRIFVLTDVLRRRGVYNKKYKELSTLPIAGDNVYLAMDNFEEFMSEGALEGAFQSEDLTPLVTVLDGLHKQRRELIQLTYELTGISDLARGMTDPDETLGAQKLKMTFGSGRFQARQKESRRFAADAYALKGELIAEWFSREQLQEMSGVKLPTMAEKQKAAADLQNMKRIAQQAAETGQQLPPFDQFQVEELQEIAAAPFTWERIESVLRTDRRRCYMVEMETDQTSFKDEDADKKARIEFLGLLTNLMTTFGPMISGNPANGQIFKTMMMFVVASFKVGRAIEQDFEQAIDAAIQQAVQLGGQNQQNPEAVKAQTDMMAAQLRVQGEQIKLQKEQVQLQRAQVEAQNAGADVQIGRMQAQQKLASDNMKLQQQAEANALKREGQQIDNVNKVEQLNFERATRATAREAVLLGPTQRPNGV